MISGDRFGFLQYMFPHDRMADAWVCSYKDQAIALFKIVIGVRRGVKSERFLVGGDCGGHALSCVAVAMERRPSQILPGHQGTPSPRSGFWPVLREGDRLISVLRPEFALKLFA